MKRILRILLCISIFIFLSNKVDARVITVTECEYTEQYENWLTLSDYERSNTMQPTKCKNNGIFYIKPVYAGAVGSVSQTSFDLRQGGYDTGPKSQENLSLCWAFADLNSVESNLLINNIKNGSEKYDFSEAHEELMLQNELFNTAIPIVRNFDVGGNYDLSAAYFFNRLGPVLESDVPFSLVEDAVNGVRTPTLGDLGDYKAVVSVNDSVEFSADIGPCSQTSITSIKNYIVTNGGISSLTFFDIGNYADSVTRQYYFSSINDGNGNPNLYNHQLSIIGWDDNILASNFRSSTGEVPSRNGAWVVKNSNNYSLRISGRGDGYDYVSYDDPFICTNLAGFYNVSTDLDDNVYVYDEVGVNMIYSVSNSNVAYVANKFSKKSNAVEQLNKVTFYSYTVNQPYEILYSSDGQLGNFTSLYTGTTNKIGYTTVDLSNKNIKITNPNFAVSIKYTKGENDILLPVFIEMDEAWYGNLKVTTGRSFYSLNGQSWNNLVMGSDKAYASIKVYTDDVTASSNIYNVTFSYGDGVSSVGTSSSSCTTDGNSCSVTLPSITANTGYQVLGWFLNLSDDEAIGQPGDSYTLSGNATLYAKTQSITTTYTVTLHFDDGAVVSENTSLMCTTSAGQNSCHVTLPQIQAKSGYDALGWYNASTGGSRVDDSSLTINVNSNIDLYARTMVSSTTYTATFNTSNGVTSVGASSSNCTTQNGSSKCNITLPTIIADTGYNVLGWYNDNTLIGQPGGSYELSGNITLVAKAELKSKTYTATFNTSNGVTSVGTSSSNCTTQNGSNKCNITLPTITANASYTVLGWYNNNTLIGQPGDSYELSGNITLVAKAESNPQTYTAIFRTTDGVTSIGKNSLSCNLENGNQKCNIVLPTITPDSQYEVLGWYNASTGGTKVGNANDTYELSGNITLYARVKEKPKTYTATFQIGDGIASVATSSSNCTTQNGSNKCNITLPTMTVKSGYNALGWYNANTGGAKVGDANDTYELSSSITLYALAERVNTQGNETIFTVTLKKADNNAIIDKSSLSCNTTGNSCVVTLPQIRTSSGYVVLGWYNAESGGVKVGDPQDEYTVTGDKTLYARVMKNPTNDPSVTNDDTIVVNKNPNNSDYTSGNINNNPQTGNKKIFITLIIAMSLFGGLYYNYHLKSSKLLNN